MSEKSKRFAPTLVTEKLVPVFLALILLGLIAIVAVSVLSLFGLIPGA